MKFIKKLFLISLLMSSVGLTNVYGNEGYPCENFFITGDYLLWKAHVGKLEYAIDGLNGPVSAGGTKELDWKWDSGFKVGAGYVFSDCCWDIYLNYTRFYTKAKGSAFPSSGNVLHSTYANLFLFDINFASSEFELNYNTLDLEMGKEFCLFPCVLFHPQFGLRGAWTKDTDDIFYDGFADDENIHLTESFRGVGPRVGLSTAWNFCKGFSLFGEGDYALVWGKNRSSFFSRTTNLGVFANTGQQYFTLRHLIDLKVGLGWDYCFCPSRLSLQLAWEHRLWLDYNQYFRFVDQFSLTYLPNSSSLSLYGLTLTARYYF